MKKNESIISHASLSISDVNNSSSKDKSRSSNPNRVTSVHEEKVEEEKSDEE